MSCYILLQTGGRIIKEAGDGFILLTNCVVDVLGGGGAGGDLRRYRRKLERIAQAAEQRQFRKVKRKIEGISAQEIERLPVQAKNIITEIKSEIDLDALSVQYSALVSARLNELLRMLDIIVRSEILREQEEELILLMAGVV